MLLRNQMEEKLLNFNKPLLSVRRFTTGAAVEKDGKGRSDKSVPNVPQPPRYKSDLKSGPVRNPGTVPFVWEQSPGRPKNETKPDTRTVERPLSAPKLPPGRALKAEQQDTDNASAKPCSNLNQVGIISHGSRESPPLVESFGECGSPIGTKEEEKKPSLEDVDEAYLDALDTLSRTESFFINCSVSGLSGLDDADVKTSRNSAMDPQTRDFMMGRFLPAAKAMASETPQHAPRKPQIIMEQPRQLKKVANADKQHQLRYGPNFASEYSRHHDSGDEESDYDYDEQEIFPSKVCGLLPCLGFKSSFCLLNPLPGISVRTRAPLSNFRREAQARSSSSGSCTELDSEQYQADLSEQRSIGGNPMTKLQVDRYKGKQEGYQTCNPSNYKKLGGTSPHRQLEVGGALSNANGSHQSSEHKATGRIPEEAKHSQAAGFLGSRSVPESFQELLADKNGSNELDTLSSVVEKTLYVDTVHKVQSLNTIFSSSNTKKQSGLTEKKYEMLAERIKQNRIVESPIEGIDKLSNTEKGARTPPDIQKPVEFHVTLSSDKANQDVITVSSKPFGQNQDLNESSSPKGCQMECTEKAPPETPTLRNHSEFPGPPPLPKSPTDSWLGRTLPSISGKSASIHSYLGTGATPKYQTSKPKSSDPKWETIVKTTKTQHQHMRYSVERLTPIPDT